MKGDDESEHGSHFLNPNESSIAPALGRGSRPSPAHAAHFSPPKSSLAGLRTSLNTTLV